MKKLVFLLFILALSIAANAQKNLQKAISDLQEKGYEYFVNKENDKARETFDKILELDSSNSYAYYNIALSYAREDKEIKAIEIVDKALQVCTEDLDDFYRLKATCYSGLGRFEEALPLFHKTLLLEESSFDENTHYNLGYVYYMLNKWESAIIYLNEYVENGNQEEGNFADALFYIGTSYYQLNDYEKSISYFDRAIEIEPYYTYIFNKAASLSNIGKRQEALRLIDSAIEKEPDESQFFYKKYQVYSQINETEKANKALKRANVLKPNDPDILLDLGVAYYKENKIDSAKYCYQKCISLKKSKYDVYCNLANLYAQNEITKDSAVYYYQKALIDNPKQASTYFNFGNFYKNQEKYEMAIQMYEQAIVLDSNLSNAYTNLAVVYSEKKDLKSAIRYALKAVEMEPNDYGNNALLADLYFEFKEYKNTIKHATSALQIDKKGYFTTKLFEIRALSRQYLEEYNNAIADYLDMLENASNKFKKENSSIYSNIGYCYLEQNELENALIYFNTSLKYNNEIDALIGLFTVQYQMNNIVEFKKSFAKALKTEPKLKAGMKGINQLENEGYFYTKKHKEILTKIFAK
jgi:tetratricopeptide (TPR) repeat protein